MINGMSGDEDSNGEIFINSPYNMPPQMGDTNISNIINHSINNIITKIDNSGTQNNYYMPHTEGEVSANSMVSSVINSAIQNLNTRSTSAIISNTISNLNNYNPIVQSNNIPTNPNVAADVDYNSVLQWLETAATNVSAPLAPGTPTITPNNPPIMNSYPSYSTPQQAPFLPQQPPTPASFQQSQILTLPQQGSPFQSPQQISSPQTSPQSQSSPTSPQSPASPILSQSTEVPSLPTLNVTIYTRASISAPPSYSYVTNLLKHSPQSSQKQDPDPLLQNPAQPHNITIPFCSAGGLVQTLSLLRQYSSIDMNLPVHIDYTYKSLPLKVQPVALIEISGPTLVDCNDAFGQVFGFKSARELMSNNRPLADYMLPEGIAISRRTIDLFFKLKTSKIERYQVFLLRNHPARVFLTQHELVGSRHRTITFLEEYPDFPICFFAEWIKTTLPNAILPPCSRPYCHCKYPDDQMKIA